MLNNFIKYMMLYDFKCYNLGNVLFSPYCNLVQLKITLQGHG